MVNLLSREFDPLLAPKLASFPFPGGFDPRAHAVSTKESDATGMPEQHYHTGQTISCGLR
ncbi:MAG: hypothetical protein C5B58_07130 [Acidobacteria bacterium]|nr:MAG: hypothetical protein C5B58_07130 [Acidobacteriota bacterium]